MLYYNQKEGQRVPKAKGENTMNENNNTNLELTEEQIEEMLAERELELMARAEWY